MAPSTALVSVSGARFTVEIAADGFSDAAHLRCMCLCQSPVHVCKTRLAMKQKALEKIVPPKTKAQRFRPDDQLLRFLESL